jgi:hypothetical protein
MSNSDSTAQFYFYHSVKHISEMVKFCFLHCTVAHFFKHVHNVSKCIQKEIKGFDALI